MTTQQILAEIQALPLANKMNLLELLVKEISASVLPTPNESAQPTPKVRKKLSQEQIEWIENEYRTNPDLHPFKDMEDEEFVDLSEYLLD